MNRAIFSIKTIGYIIIVALVITVSGCKEKFPFPQSAIDKSYLVVEGFINIGNDSTRIKLSRTVTPDDSLLIRPERSALVLVESSSGYSQYLFETGAGEYTAGPLAISPAEKYRLSIQTNNGKQYLSDFVDVKQVPPIDSISWVRTAGGIQVYANTHDPQNATRYYAWQFNETWEFRSNYISNWEYINEMMVPRYNPSGLYTCWQSAASTSILIGSSAKLTNDVIHRAPLAFIPDDSWKLSVKYSINVKQSALSKGAFDYLEKMKKNSEQMGSIFDPQPSTSSGNIYCSTDPNEMVIGYMYASSIVEKRIFINRSEVPGWRYNLYCEVITVPNNRDSLDLAFTGNYNLVINEIRERGFLLGYTGSTGLCIDCTLRGTNVKPDFWP
ncbi:DUF4249 domain-containing protein [Agriterribacter sp.]|uniref:DUF4249 domain-containing protein n=1 Tax=Agriterribacter sp. TaxID=2821509 RepID=UPI002C0A32BA|nr:DUF4249 domain-containing protein [Agriterribacter sp.]HTN06790.1 DUF4249 domain-containing protein [Agriterribacter sp.]